jgi:hypothetical protein
MLQALRGMGEVLGKDAVVGAARWLQVEEELLSHREIDAT